MSKMSKPKTERPERIDEVQLAHRMVNAFVQKHEASGLQGPNEHTTSVDQREQLPTAAPKKSR